MERNISEDFSSNGCGMGGEGPRGMDTHALISLSGATT